MISLDDMSRIPHLRLDTVRMPTLCISPETEKRLVVEARAILWCNDGLFGLIPVERVMNEVILRNEKSGAGIEPTPLVFYWSDVAVIPDNVRSIRRTG